MCNKNDTILVTKEDTIPVTKIDTILVTKKEVKMIIQHYNSIYTSIANNNSTAIQQHLK
jgi:hypothetical protein